MKEIKLNDDYIYIDDSEVDEKETGVIIKDEELEKTQELNLEDKLSNTNTNIWSENNE